MINRKIQIIGWVCGIICLLSGCIREDECEPIPPPPIPPDSYIVSFSFVYEFNRYYEDRFKEEIDYIDFFLYDSEGKLYTHREIQQTEMREGYIIQLSELPVGEYTAVAWGKCDSDYYETIGVETLSTHKVNLACVEDGEVKEKEFSNLFHAVNHFTVKEDVTIPMEMVKNNNLLRIRIQGMRENDRLWAEDILYARIESYNRTYNYNNSWGSEEWISYIPHHYELIEEDEEVIIEFHVLQLSAEDQDTKISLRFRDSDARTHFMEELIIPNLMNQYIAPLRSEIPVISFEEYVARYDEFDLYFHTEYEEKIDGLEVTIKPWDGIKQPGEL